MSTVKEPYYLESYNTSIKSFTLPLIPKSSSFKSSVSRRSSIRESIRKEIIDAKASNIVSLPSEPTLNTNTSGLFRSNSLEPYYRPHISINYDLDDSAIVDDQDEFENTDDEILSFKPVKSLPPMRHCHVRDDYDNDTKFDFYI